MQDYNSYTGTDYVHYEIPIGQHYTGSFNHLFFVNDHDVSSPDGEGYFSNVRVYESSGAQAALRDAVFAASAYEANQPDDRDDAADLAVQLLLATLDDEKS
jgi:hypothetical protein